MSDNYIPEIGEKSSKSNVTSIKGATQKKAPLLIKKPSQAKICQLLSDAVRRDKHSLLAEFPVRYLVYEPKPGVSVPLLVADDDSVTVTSSKAIANDVLRYCNNELSGIPEYVIKPRLSLDVSEHFLAVQPPVEPEAIKIVRWADEPGLTYRRLPWVKQTGDTPTWDALLSRMSNNQAFIDWIGSLFFEGAYLHNYVWIYGEGGDGKGAINRFLAKVFETSYRSKTAPSMDRNGTVDKFWAYNLLGARLAVFPDCENSTFTTSGFFKSLTGGDPVEVEAKGSMPFTVYLNTRYMILANVKPAMTSAKSNIRRIIYCEMEPTEQDWAGIERRLWEEGGYFLSQCVENYLAKYPKHGPLETDNSALMGVIDENEQHHENFFNEYFVLSEDGYATAKDIKVAAEEAWPRQRKTYREFLAWLKRVHGIECAIEWLGDGQTERRYKGMGRKKAVIAQKTISNGAWHD